VPWAEQGVLLLNAVLTVRAHEANSHKGKGWELFTDAAIRAVNASERPVVFVLWGGYAQKKVALVDSSRHAIISSAPPSPLGARPRWHRPRPWAISKRPPMRVHARRSGRCRGRRGGSPS